MSDASDLHMTSSCHGNAGVCLVLGGARSGKSLFAERQIESTGLDACYIATAEALDAEMAERIRLHRQRRGDAWRTVEEPLHLAKSLDGAMSPGSAVLVDCLTIWLANVMASGSSPEGDIDGLLRVLGKATGHVVLVSNEVGMGIVPDNALARTFRDEAGTMHQRIAAIAGRVIFVAAGLPLVLKGPPPDSPSPASVPGGPQR
ncbi:MAG: bifunctional adenosylcobinamide kinase/adenosylcobinamide-phosphate guanylyltransferase [bacterium]|nr:bifunctional adenosylcobinamide kinase/adenosylcobinamide-phosphate guanylyltransferase [bacterium]